MKKMFVSMMAVAMSLCSMAANTITITLNGDNGDANYESSVVLVEDANRNATYEAGYDAECLSTDPSGILGVMLYGFVGNKKCEFIYSNSLKGINFGFTSNVTETTYHLYISANFANSYKLYDNVANQYIPLDGSVADYEFTAVAGRVNVENRFSIPAPYDVTLNNDYLATFSAVDNVVIPAGLKAYQAKYESMTEVLTLNAIANYIPANTGVILYNEAKDNKNFSLEKYTGTDDMPAIALNDLKPASAWSYPAAGTIYILHGAELWEYTGADFVANKAYLELPVSTPAPKRIRLAFDQATAIDNVEAEAVKAEKFVENGQIFIRRGNEVFNLQGQIVK